MTEATGIAASIIRWFRQLVCRHPTKDFGYVSVAGGEDEICCRCGKVFVRWRDG